MREGKGGRLADHVASIDSATADNLVPRLEEAVHDVGLLAGADEVVSDDEAKALGKAAVKALGRVGKKADVREAARGAARSRGPVDTRRRRPRGSSGWCVPSSRPRPNSLRAVRRELDVVAAAAGLALASPLLALAAAAVKLEDGGPVLYRQTRVGKDGADFELLKLRTMVVGAETIGAGYAVDRGRLAHHARRPRPAAAVARRAAAALERRARRHER